MKANKIMIGICIILLSTIALASTSSESGVNLEYKLDSGTRRNSFNESDIQLTYNLRAGTQPQVLTSGGVVLDITPTNKPPQIVNNNDLFNFSKLTTEVVWAALSLIFNNSFGTIDFAETIDISGRETVDLDSFVEISSNYIYINDTALSELNKSAEVTIRDLTFSNVRVLKNGEDCLGCTIVSYSSGDVIFTVPGFAIYQGADGSVSPAIRIATNVIVTNASINVTGDTYNSTFPNNITIDMGNDGSIEFSSSGEFNSSSLFANFTDSLNGILPSCDCPGCTLSNSNLTCTVALNITSDTQGTVELSDLNVSQVINNATWEEDNTYNLIDLDDYFYDLDRDTLSYSYSSAENISISIVSGMVILRPDANFYGIRSIMLNASDGTNTTLSNNVTVTISNVPEVYRDTYDGRTTDFSVLNNSQLQNLSNIILEREAYGMINFTQTINISEDTNFDLYVNISQNRIFLNSSNLTRFNASAIVRLYNLTFSDPRVLRNGSVCSSDICTELTYSKGNLTFNVTTFTLYSTEETPVPAQTSGDTGGGAGGEAAAGPVRKPAVSNFTIEPELIKTSIVQGKTKTITFKVSNTGDTTQRIRIEPDEFAVSLLFSETEFSLSPGESKTINVDVTAKKELAADIYTGKIYVKSPSITRTLRLVVEVEARVALFDIKVMLPKASKRGILRGEFVQADISMFNLGDLKPVDVELEYSIKDVAGNVITGRTETLAVNTELGITRKLQVPENLEYGDYLFYAKISYGREKAVASELFEVVKEKLSMVKYYAPYTLGIGLGVIFFILTLIVFMFLAKKWIFFTLRKGRRDKLLEREKQKELKLRLEKKELKERLKTEKIREHERLIRESIKFKELELKEKEKGRKEREKKELEEKKRKEEEKRAEELRKREERKRRLEEAKERKAVFRRERTRRLHGFLHSFGLYKTEEDKREEQQKRRLEAEKKEKERTRLGRLRRRETEDRKEKGVAIKRGKRRRLEEEKERKAIAKRERTRKRNELLRRFGLYKGEDEKKKEERKRAKELRRKEELGKKARLEEERRKKEKAKQEEKKREIEEEDRKRKESELKQKLRKKVSEFDLLSRKTSKYIEKRNLNRVVSSYSKLKGLYDKLIAMPLEATKKKGLYSKLNGIYLWVYKKKQAELLSSEKEDKAKRERLEILKKREEESRRAREEERKRLNELRELKKAEKEKAALEELRKRKKKAGKDNLRRLLHGFGLYKSKKEKREEKRRKAEESRRKEEERIRKERLEKKRRLKEENKRKIRKSLLEFDLLGGRASKLIEEENLEGVISVYPKLKGVYDKLITLPLKNEEKKGLYSRLNGVYLWICKEKQAAREREERRRAEEKKRLEEEKRQESLRKKREEKEKIRKEKELRRLNEQRKREEEKRRKEAERKRLEEQRRVEEERKEQERLRKKRDAERKKQEKLRKKMEAEERKRAEALKKERKLEEQRKKKEEIKPKKEGIKLPFFKKPEPEKHTVEGRKKRLELKQEVIEFNELIIQANGCVEQGNKEKALALLSRIEAKYNELLSYSLPLKDKSMISVRMKWIRERIGEEYGASGKE
ncbi:hypothetical protein CMO89_04520 [Candidatus Woesearchaeota archaeon]|nr:hypothetical protein [Candidatus Woesearchaeota archaeon]|tara:strand:+ start:4507 stop:9210 length:4704 start_codon:yes stop_codon:yes gene_type:complete